MLSNAQLPSLCAFVTPDVPIKRYTAVSAAVKINSECIMKYIFILAGWQKKSKNNLVFVDFEKVGKEAGDKHDENV